jgi:YVTN family beta-propeller protein
MDVMQATSRDFWWSKRDSMRTAAASCASLALGFLFAACTASGEDVRPPQDQLFFPSGLAAARQTDSAGVLFVANSNSELRYDSGAISVIDLGSIEQVLEPWLADRAPGSCTPDLDHRETLVCDESLFINRGASVRIGNFATDIAVQDFSSQGVTQLRVIVPTRGDPSITWADYDGARLSCASGTAAFAVCDAAHRLSTVRNDPNLPILDEPFAVFADAANGFAVVTHLVDGAVTLIDAPREGFVQLSDVVRGIFLSDPAVSPGATGVVGRAPGSPNNIVYVGSRTENRIQTFTVGRPVNEAAPYLLPGNYLLLDGVGAFSGNSFETRGMQFSPDGNRLYVTNRRPPTLQVIDTSLSPGGFPRNVPAGASDICRQASNLVVVDADDGERVYVTCFQDGEVYVIDARGQTQVEDIVTVGRGPYAIVASPDKKRLFVSNFLEDTIAVIDIDPTSNFRNRVVLRIGEPRAL